jgi:hypothetical protein
MEPAVLMVQDCPYSVANRIEFVCVNEGSDLIQLVGAEKKCGGNCCVDPKFGSRINVPSGGKAVVPFELLMTKPASEFSLAFSVYFEWRNRTYEHQLSVSGTSGARPKQVFQTP